MTPDDTFTTPAPDTSLLDPGLSVRADRRLIRANGRSERFLLVDVDRPDRRAGSVPAPAAGQPRLRARPVGLDGQPAQARARPPGGARGLHRLDDPDRFSVVVYDNEVEVVVSSVLASSESKRLAATRLGSVDARGSTDLHGGWLAGCEQVAGGLQPMASTACCC